tara:strand:+ start:1178 stop:1555 length:378 start_codon:yes stop_codon:yes gene_type:complete
MPSTLPNTSVEELIENVLPGVFSAIRQVETGGCADPSEAVGANGELGPFQIGYSYYLDALEHDSSLAGLEFEGVRDSHIARLIMIAYWERYAVEWTPQELCRLHNGGPTKRNTDIYWEKCKKFLQ